MFVFVECCPSSPDTISDFGRFLLLESYHLAQVFCTFFSCQNFDFDVINLNFFSDVRALVAENFRLSWMDSESHFFCTVLESRTACFGAVLLRMQIGARRQQISCL